MVLGQGVEMCQHQRDFLLVIILCWCWNVLEFGSVEMMIKMKSTLDEQGKRTLLLVKRWQYLVKYCLTVLDLIVVLQ